MPEKPDYVKNFDKPPYTEIKCISGHWYLYERSSVYDRKLGRSKKISGKCLGKITEQGLIPSKSWSQKTFRISDYDEVSSGIKFVFLQTQQVGYKLKKYFPEIWQQIYAIAVIRAACACNFQKLQQQYEGSILFDRYPGLSFSVESFTRFLSILGQMQDAMCNYMKNAITEYKYFLLFNEYELTHSMEYNMKHKSDLKMFNKPQNSLFHIFSVGRDIGCPVYYKQYPEIISINESVSDILGESTIKDNKCIFISDENFINDKELDSFEKKRVNYVLALKRENHFVKGYIPRSPFEYKEAFIYNTRGVHSLTISQKNVNIHLYLEMDTMAQEIADIIRKAQEKEHNGSKRYHEKSEMIAVKEIHAAEERSGTIILKTNCKDLSAYQIYNIYKQGHLIKKLFETYKEIRSYDPSYLNRPYAKEAWLFLNYITFILIGTIGWNEYPVFRVLP